MEPPKYSIHFSLQQQTPLLIKSYRFDNSTHPTKQTQHLVNSAIVPALNDFLSKEKLSVGISHTWKDNNGNTHNAYDFRLYLLNHEKLVGHVVVDNYKKNGDPVEFFGGYFGYLYENNLEFVLISHHIALINEIRNNDLLCDFFVQNRFYGKSGKGFGQFLIPNMDNETARKRYFTSEIHPSFHIITKSIFHYYPIQDNGNSFRWTPNYLLDYKEFKSGLRLPDSYSHSKIGTEVFRGKTWEKKAIKVYLKNNYSKIYTKIYYKNPEHKDLSSSKTPLTDTHFVRPLAGLMSKIEFLMSDESGNNIDWNNNLTISISALDNNGNEIQKYRFPSLIQFRIYDDKVYLLIPKATHPELSHISNKPFKFVGKYNGIDIDLFTASNQILTTPDYSTFVIRIMAAFTSMHCRTVNLRTESTKWEPIE